MLGGHRPTCEALLSAGADTEAIDGASCTTLHIAALHGHAGVCEALLAGGAETEAKTIGGGTALHMTAYAGHADACLVLLAAGADHGIQNAKCGWTALHYAAYGGHTLVCEALLTVNADVDAKGMVGGNATALHVAVANGQTQVCKVLLEAGAGLEARACNHGQAPLHLAAERGFVAECEVLLKAGADIAAHTESGGGTALQIAAFRGHEAICEALLAAGADTEAKHAKGGWTALHYAAYGGCAKTCEVLLSSGANKDATAQDGKTPRAVALERGHASFEWQLSNILEIELEAPDVGAILQAEVLRHSKPPMLRSSQCGKMLASASIFVVGALIIVGALLMWSKSPGPLPKPPGPLPKPPGPPSSCSLPPPPPPYISQACKNATEKVCDKHPEKPAACLLCVVFHAKALANSSCHSSSSSELAAAFCGTGPDETQQQEQALLAFKASLDPRTLRSWVNGTDPCEGTWRGLTCGRDGFVTMIGLEDSSISGTLSESLGCLTTLTTLYLGEYMPDRYMWI
eukprot:SAG31_NODE_4734_length_2994_cov_2.143005_1_plen_518_part_00